MPKYLANTAASLQWRNQRSHRTAIALTVALNVTAVCCTGLAAAPPWAAPRCPPVPMKAGAAHGVSLGISGPYRAALLGPVNFRVTVTNHGKRPLSLSQGDPIWLQFPGTWCWGPGTFRPTRFLREVGGGYRVPHALFASIEESVPPGGQCVLGLLDFSHIFDLSIPGKYKAQLAGMGMVSNVITFRVLPPNNQPTGPAVGWYDGKAPRFTMVWGAIRDGLQMGTYVKFNPNGRQEVRVHLFFRNVARNARAIRLTGNPEVDFAHCRTVGPCFGSGAHLGALYGRINNQPTPLTAYGKRIAKEHVGRVRWHTYTLGAGKLYEYWRPLLLNRRYDLSVPGPYTFSTRLTNTRLHTGAITIYVGVQPRVYNMPLFNRWLKAWKKKHGVG